MLKKILIFSFLVSIIACDNSLSTKEKQEYITKGEEITLGTFNELSSHIMQQMKLGGPAQAISFCNLEANSITEQMAEKFNVSIRRTSNQLRSCSNEPNDHELEIINNYEQLIKKEKPVSPIIEVDKNNKKHFYAPIKIQSQCLVCHGKINETLNMKTDSIIKLFYPFDKATGYSEGDLRGIWNIEFNN